MPLHPDTLQRLVFEIRASGVDHQGVYLAASYDRYEEIQDLATDLYAQSGFRISSTWHIAERINNARWVRANGKDTLERQRGWADAHIRDLDDSGVLVFFQGGFTPGKYFELGLAVGWRKHIIMVEEPARIEVRLGDGEVAHGGGFESVFLTIGDVVIRAKR